MSVLYANIWIFCNFSIFERNGTSNKGDANPFEEEEWDDSDALVDTGEPGVPVKALYDYEGAENDELTFKTGLIFTNHIKLYFNFSILGEIFEKLEDEDEQGWCKGRKDGRVGLYPANYVELASHWCRKVDFIVESFRNLFLSSCSILL